MQTFLMSTSVIHTLSEAVLVKENDCLYSFASEHRWELTKMLGARETISRTSSATQGPLCFGDDWPWDGSERFKCGKDLLGLYNVFFSFRKSLFCFRCVLVLFVFMTDQKP